MDSSEIYSIHVSKTLDCMGYNKDMIKYRVLKYKECSELCIEKLGTILMVVGSKGEGLSAPMKNDYDIMVVTESVRCDAYPNQRDTVFEIDTRDSPPGYTKLKLIKVIEDNVIVNSLVHFVDRGLYISSEIYLKYNVLSEILEAAKIIENAIPPDVSSISISGPAAKRLHYIEGIKYNSDVVSSFPCRHLSLLDSWKYRHRDYNWPHFEFRRNIHNTDMGYVVPVGPKGSDNQYLEWRICFTTIEQKLIQLLNDTQTKLYVLLKIVAKEIIQPKFEDITSYLMKNIVLWMAELVPEEQFRDNLLIDKLIQALHYLKHCIKTNCLPSYMIPERNLLARKMTYSQRLKLADTLSEIISNGGSIFLSCKQFKLFTVCMYKVPQITLRFALKRDLIERLYLLNCKTSTNVIWEGIINKRFTNATQIQDVLFSNKLTLTINTMLIGLLIPEWKLLVEQGIDLFYIINYCCMGRLQYYLS